MLRVDDGHGPLTSNPATPEPGSRTPAAGLPPAVRALRARLEAAADPEFAAFHRAYHKSSRRFYGLRTPAFRAIFREVFPARPALGREETLALARALWASEWAEERSAALALLDRGVKLLQPSDLAWLHRLTRECEGWGSLDWLATRILGSLALAHPDEVYPVVRAWSDDAWLWTRRAAILVHVLPARRRALAAAYAWPTFEERLPEKDFFIRKAIGWALRECTRHHADDVLAFLLRVGDRASGLTRREAARRLPEALRRRLAAPPGRARDP